MNVVIAVNMGGDDFVVKPFDLEILQVKIQVLLRRAYAFTAAGGVISRLSAEETQAGTGSVQSFGTGAETYRHHAFLGECGTCLCRSYCYEGYTTYRTADLISE